MALLVTTGFLCAAAFVFVLNKYGPVQACLTGAAIFFVVTLIAAGSYMVRKKQIEARAEQAARNGEIHRADRAGRPDAGCGRHPGDPRHRRQETDPDPRGRRDSHWDFSPAAPTRAAAPAKRRRSSKGATPARAVYQSTPRNISWIP
jgi:hypothetical protein